MPDVSVFVWNRIPTDDNGEIANVFPIAPDWTIEILSPDQSQTKVTKNILHCLNHQTQMGWLIDPDEQCVFVYLTELNPLTAIHEQLSFPDVCPPQLRSAQQFEPIYQFFIVILPYGLLVALLISQLSRAIPSIRVSFP